MSRPIRMLCLWAVRPLVLGDVPLGGGLECGLKLVWYGSQLLRKCCVVIQVRTPFRVLF